MVPPDESHVSPAQLVAFADGTLDPAYRREVEALLASSPELRAHERERQVVRLLHDARATGRAPARLRARFDAQRRSARVIARRRVRYAGGLAGAFATAAVGLALALPAGTPGSPSVSEAAGLAARGPSQSAPGPDARFRGSRLARAVDDVYFPNWFASLGWRAVGQRTDRLTGRRAITVYYAWRGARVAYTIFGGPALSQPSARIVDLNGIELRTLTVDARRVVT